MALVGCTAVIAFGLRGAEVGERAEAAPEARQEAVRLLVADLETADARAAGVGQAPQREAGERALEPVVGATGNYGVDGPRVVENLLQGRAHREETDRLELFLDGEFKVVRRVRA